MRPTDALPHPDDWDTTTVGRSVDLKRGVSWSKDQEHAEPGSGRVPVIGISNVQTTLELEDQLYLSGLKPAVVEKSASQRAGLSSLDQTAIVPASETRQLSERMPIFFLPRFSLVRSRRPTAGLALSTSIGGFRPSRCRGT